MPTRLPPAPCSGAVSDSLAQGSIIAFHAVAKRTSGKLTDITNATTTLWTSDNPGVAQALVSQQGAFVGASQGCACISASAGGRSSNFVGIAVFASATPECSPCETPGPTSTAATPTSAVATPTSAAATPTLVRRYADSAQATPTAVATPTPAQATPTTAATPTPRGHTNLCRARRHLGRADAWAHAYTRGNTDSRPDDTDSSHLRARRPRAILVEQHLRFYRSPRAISDAETGAALSLLC